MSATDIGFGTRIAFITYIEAEEAIASDISTTTVITTQTSQCSSAKHVSVSIMTLAGASTTAAVGGLLIRALGGLLFCFAREYLSF
jgi:hypothetical protein